MKERLQKVIARAGLMSRRQAEEALREGRVSVDGVPAHLGQSADPETAEVRVDGVRLTSERRSVTLMLNKPCGYICSLKDPQGRRLASELIPRSYGRLFHVGRLDYNTEGLLLLTNDGELAQHLMHPRHHVPKTYLVKVRGELTAARRSHLEQGLELDDGPTAPARVAAVRRSGHNTWFELTLREGRNRQVRRMCEAVELPVVRLKRIALGPLLLGELSSGKFRELGVVELRDLKKAVGL